MTDIIEEWEERTDWLPEIIKDGIFRPMAALGLVPLHESWPVPAQDKPMESPKFINRKIREIVPPNRIIK
jgi:hypothetical protein